MGRFVYVLGRADTKHKYIARIFIQPLYTHLFCRYGDLTKEHLNIIKTCAEGEDTNGVFMSAETIYTKIGVFLAFSIACMCCSNRVCTKWRP